VNVTLLKNCKCVHPVSRGPVGVQADGEVVVRLHHRAVLQAASGALQGPAQLHRGRLSVLQSLASKVMMGYLHNPTDISENCAVRHEMPYEKTHKKIGLILIFMLCRTTDTSISQVV
jgi:hypothetical protein